MLVFILANENRSRNVIGDTKLQMAKVYILSYKKEISQIYNFSHLCHLGLQLARIQCANC